MYDFIIVGAGIIGMSTAMQLGRAYPDRRILVLEKEDAPARHQSGHNSGVIHAGVYYTPGSLKATFCLEGNRATKQFCADHGLAYQECGKLLVATNAVEMRRMQALWDRTEASGLQRTWLSAAELSEREPNIVGLAGVLVPSTGIVSYAEMVRAMSDDFTSVGGEVSCSARVVGLVERRDEVVVSTASGDYSCRYLVVCGGLMADRLVGMLGKRPDFTICPFRGEYYLLSPKHNEIVKHLIYPIPDPAMPFLGVHLTRMIDGSVTVGPNAVLALKREGYRRRDISLRDTMDLLTNPAVRKLLKDHARAGLGEMRNSLSKTAYLAAIRKYCPALDAADLIPYPAGVRAQAVGLDGRMIDDFHVFSTRRTLHVCNAPSPAATSSIPIGAYIVEKVRQQAGSLKG